MTKNWRVHLFVRHQEDGGRLDQVKGWYGFVRNDERLIHLFPDSFAPSGLDRLRLRLRRRADGWYAKGSCIEHATRVVVHSLEQIHSRMPFKPRHLKVLKDSTVAFIGLGSIGSELAVSMAQGGVANMILADPALLSIENVTRHVGHLLDVGRPKVTIVEERIKRINPFANVEAHVADIFEWPNDRIDGLLARSSLIIASADVRAVQLTANDRAHGLRVSFMSVGCYDEAMGGEVFYTLPGTGTACYCCLRGNLPTPRQSRAIDYSTAEGPEDYKGEPALSAAVRQIADVAAQMAIALLLRDESDSRLGELIDPRRQFLLIGSALAQGFYRFRKPFDVFFQPLSGPRNGCFTCSSEVQRNAGGSQNGA